MASLGPCSVITLLLMAFLTACSLHCALEVFPPKANLYNRVFCAFLTTSVTIMSYFFFVTMNADPGYVIQGWYPAREADKNRLNFCKHCRGYKPRRSHHCSKCNRCVRRMDHHCPFLGNCVGHNNHVAFMLFVFFALLSVITGIIPVSAVLWRAHAKTEHIHPLGLTSLLLAEVLLLVFGSVVTALMWTQVQGLATNQTFLERYKAEMARYEQAQRQQELRNSRSQTHILNHGQQILSS